VRSTRHLHAEPHHRSGGCRQDPCVTVMGEQTKADVVRCGFATATSSPSRGWRSTWSNARPTREAVGRFIVWTGRVDHVERQPSMASLSPSQSRIETTSAFGLLAITVTQWSCRAAPEGR